MGISLDEVMAMDAGEAEGWMRFFIAHPPDRLLVPLLLARFIFPKDVDFSQVIPGVLEQMYFDWPDAPGQKIDPKEERRRHLEATMGHSILVEGG